MTIVKKECGKTKVEKRAQEVLGHQNGHVTVEKRAQEVLGQTTAKRWVEKEQKRKVKMKKQIALRWCCCCFGVCLACALLKAPWLQQMTLAQWAPRRRARLLLCHGMAALRLLWCSTATFRATQGFWMGLLMG